MKEMGKRGVFISFEGTEGAGKSTVIRLLARQLKRRHGIRTVVLTREPGGTPIAEKIRKLVVGERVGAMAELFLMEASRAEHVATKIEPALRAGHWVLCDRFADSSMAYQGHARGLGWTLVSQLNKMATAGLSPDRSVFLDVRPSVGLKRARVRTRFEKAGTRFQSKVRQGFLRAIAEDPRRWIVINTELLRPDEAVEVILAGLKKWLKHP